MISLLKKGKSLVGDFLENLSPISIIVTEDNQRRPEVVEEVINVNIEKDPFGNVISKKTSIRSRRNSIASVASDLADFESDPNVIRQSVIVTEDENGNPI